MFGVVVSGLPGTGKTTLSIAVAKRLGVPLIGKDLIKETLADALISADVQPRDLGRAAISVQYALAQFAPEVVLESFFWPGVSEPDLLRLNRPLIQVHCWCTPAIAEDRTDKRIAGGERHKVHLDLPLDEALAATRGRLALPGPTIEIDTTYTVDLNAVIEEIRGYLQVL